MTHDFNICIGLVTRELQDRTKTSGTSLMLATSRWVMSGEALKPHLHYLPFKFTWCKLHIPQCAAYSNPKGEDGSTPYCMHCWHSAELAGLPFWKLLDGGLVELSKGRQRTVCKNFCQGPSLLQTLTAGPGELGMRKGGEKKEWEKEWEGKLLDEKWGF